jgi:glycosyltransferase involved in cell wall biosynthesis
VIGRPDDVEALQEAIERWLDPERREFAREECAKRARSYSIDRNLAETLNVLEGLRVG